jgi:hypothetical protein
MRNPFIVGSWVRGERFFGRADLIGQLLEGPRDTVWVVGARRIGKTSLLKELELRAHQNPHSPFIPLYWDLQGSGDARGMADDLLSSVEDNEAFRRAIDLPIEDLEEQSVGDMLTTLVRRTARSGWRLLLLIDEAEELLAISSSPGLLPRLRRIFQRGPEVRTVMAATRRLARIGEQAELATSPFLHGFEPPLYLTPFSRAEATALLAQGNYSPEACERIMAQTANHPFLIQLVASRSFESQDLDGILEQLAVDEMVANFFTMDFQTLEAHERHILQEAARADLVTAPELASLTGLGEDETRSALRGLAQMGYLLEEGSAFRVGTCLFSRWLRRNTGTRALEPRLVS